MSVIFLVSVAVAVASATAICVYFDTRSNEQ